MNTSNSSSSRVHRLRFSRKIALPLLCGALALGGACTVAYVKQRPPLSPNTSAAFEHLAKDVYLAASAQPTEALCFTAEWFDRAVGGAPVRAITVISLPEPTNGTLYLGHTPLGIGHRISRENLHYLRYIPLNGAQKSSFSFLPSTQSGEGCYVLSCNLSITDGENCCPVQKGASLAVSTHTDLAYSGCLNARDGDGDALYFELLQYPQNGTLELHAASGAFTYTPQKDFSGEDSFVWRAQDEHGAFSEAQTVSIKVRARKSSYTFDDITQSDLQSAAIRVSEAGLIGGEVICGRHYFDPQKQVTRAAFVGMLLRAAGIEAPDCDGTGFSDDADIPPQLKGAIRKAKENGWLDEAETFRPHDPITRAQAAKIAAAVLELSAPSYAEAVTDLQSIPVQIADELYALYEGGYIAAFADGSLSPAAAITREDAARFFARILDGKDEG